MARRKPRGLTAEEKALWRKVVENTQRIGPELPGEDPQKQTLFPPKPQKFALQVPPFRPGDTAVSRPALHDLAPNLSAHLATQPLAMDRKRFGRMRKGRLAPEARIDLHGMTQAQAHPALTRFILDAVADEVRLVLVITGKGKVKPDSGPIPERPGVLRHKVPHWLGSMPLKPHVLQVTEAHVKHGGDGALYVYLRRVRG